MFSFSASAVVLERRPALAVARAPRRRCTTRVFLRGHQSHDDLVKNALLSTIRAYKRYVSPGIRPACRFVPTCSEYAAEALEKFGVCRGAVLASWRVLRCNPFGGSGYDPPQWPPVRYRYVGVVPPRPEDEKEARRVNVSE